MEFIHILTILAVLVVSGYYYVRRKFSFWADLDVMYFEPTFPFGNIKGINKTRNLHDITQHYYERVKASGKKFVGLYFFTGPVALAIDLDFVKNVMVKDFQYFHDRGVYYNERDDPLSAHMFSIEGQKWKNLRAKLTPTFTSGKMKTMFPIIARIGEEFKTTMAESASINAEVEMRDLLARFTTDVIGTCAFGLECNSLKDPNAEFRKYGRKLFENINSAKQLFTSFFKSLSLKLHLTFTPKDVSDFFMNAVKDTVAYRESSNIKRNDFMDLLIEIKNNPVLENQLTIEEIAAQAFLFFLAGFETSSTVMSFALYELAANPEIQAKARECVRDTLKKHNGELTYDSMMDMTYVTQCLNESLRKYPPVPDLIRSVTTEYRVPETNVVLPKGQTVMIPVYAIQHDANFYEDPEVYDPDRFTQENEAKRNPYSFIPFGEGPRNCIGLRFGMMQARIGMAVLLNNFKFELGGRTKVPLDISKSSPILCPVDGIWLRVQKI